MSVTKNIKIELIRKDKNIVWLAERIGITKYSLYNSMQSWEKGKGYNIRTIKKIAKALDVEIAKLIG